jgi:hypothetical protein
MNRPDGVSPEHDLTTPEGFARAQRIADRLREVELPEAAAAFEGAADAILYLYATRDVSTPEHGGDL